MSQPTHEHESCNFGCDSCGSHEHHENGIFHIFEENKRRFFTIAIITWVISIYLEFFTELSMLSQIFALVTVLSSWWEVLDAAMNEIKQKKIKANTLMIAAAIGSFLIGHGQEGATAILLYALSEELEEYIVDRSQRALEDLMKLAPDVTSVKLSEGNFKEIRTEDVQVGDIFQVKPGERIPLDGTVHIGKAYIDKSAITGESELIETSIDDDVFAGTINESGYIEVITKTNSKNSTLANIITMIKQAQMNKSNTEKFIQRFATYYTPFIFILSVSLMVLGPLVFGLDPIDGIYRGLVLLVISCPCALTLSTPLGMVVGLTKLSKEGILVKGSRYLEDLEKVKHFAFDKTGTLTTGKIEIKDFIILDNEHPETKLLKIAASIEAISEHNIAKAIVEFAKSKDIIPIQIEDFNIHKGLGIKAKVEGTEYLIGSSAFLLEENISITKELENRYKLNSRPHIILGKADSKETLGIFILSDKLRISAPFVLYELGNRGYSTQILSGDKEENVEIVASSLYIKDKKGNLLPQNKLERIEHYKQSMGGIAMVGDGINDAPSLAAANIGISFGDKATDIAMKTSDISILSNNLMKILVLLDITALTNRKIKENIWIAIIVKFSFAILTVFGLMNLWVAVGIGDIGVSMFVMLNGLLILKYKNKYRKDEALEKQQDFMETLCPECKTINIISNHHEKPLRPHGDHLVCWMNDYGEEIACEYTESLFCMKCSKKLILQ